MQGASLQARRGLVALNSIHCNPQAPWQFVVGGSDCCCRVYDQRFLPGAAHGSTDMPVRPGSLSHLREGSRQALLALVML